MLHVAYDYNKDPAELAARKLLDDMWDNDLTQEEATRAKERRLARRAKRKEELLSKAKADGQMPHEVDVGGKKHYIFPANKNRLN